MNTKKVVKQDQKFDDEDYEADCEQIQCRKKNKSRVNFTQNGKYGLDYNQASLQSPSRFNQDQTQDLSHQNASQLELDSNLSLNMIQESITIGQDATSAIKPRRTVCEKIFQCVTGERWVRR